MGFFISDAMAEAATQQMAGPPGWAQPVMIMGIFAVFYFLFIMPQQKRNKEQKKMIDSLGKGSEVVTTGGLLGKVSELDDSFVQLELSEGVHVYVQRHAIASMVPKGTYKARKKAEK